MRVSITPPYKRRRMERERAAFLAALRASLVPESARDVVFASHGTDGPPICGVDESLARGGAHASSIQKWDGREYGQS